MFVCVCVRVFVHVYVRAREIACACMYVFSVKRLDRTGSLNVVDGALDKSSLLLLLL